MSILKNCVLVTGVLLISVSAQRYNQNFNQNNYNGFNNVQQQQPSKSGISFHCPEPNGTYPTSTCDGYIECKEGIAEEKLCDDGLLFNPEVRGFPCQYPIDVDCTGRTATQPPQATDDCPHQYGYFRLGDSSHCGQFMNCAAGRGYTFDCPEGLAFNSLSYRCDWPDQVPDCDPESYLGFTCPPVAKNFLFEEYRYFRSPSDCQRYFICIEGKPRMYNCGEDRAYNELTNQCDGIENVTGCAPAYNPNFDRNANPHTQKAFNRG